MRTALLETGKRAARWAWVFLAVLIITAGVTSMVLDKNHLAFPLGPGCYYLGMDHDIIQWQHCDEWRKHGN